MKPKPIETVAEAKRRAKRRLPRPIFDSLVAGYEKGITIHANIEAFDQIGFRPRPVAVRPLQRDLKTNVLGMDHRSAIEFGDAPLHLGRPCGFGAWRRPGSAPCAAMRFTLG